MSLPSSKRACRDSLVDSALSDGGPALCVGFAGEDGGLVGAAFKAVARSKSYRTVGGCSAIDGAHVGVPQEEVLRSVHARACEKKRLSARPICFNLGNRVDSTRRHARLAAT